MQNPIKPCLTLFATGLFLCLLWGFCSLGQSATRFVSVFVLVLTGGMLFWQYKQRRQVLSTGHDYTLKTSVTKVLVDALLNIKAKPGWLIRVSGYTDNTGNPEQNQKLSLKRAESVRDWMIQAKRSTTISKRLSCAMKKSLGHTKTATSSIPILGMSVLPLN